MRLVRQITYEAKDDVEALSIAKDRLGRDAIILSSRSEDRGGFLGFFRRKALVVTAGLLEEDGPSGRLREKEDPSERIMAFQRLLEVKHAVKEAFSNSSGASLEGENGREERVPVKSGETKSPPSVNAEGVTFAFSDMARQLAAKEGALSSISGKDTEEHQKIKHEIEEIRGMLHTLLERFPQEGKSALPTAVPLLSPNREKEEKQEVLEASPEKPLFEPVLEGPSSDPLLTALLAQDLDVEKAHRLVRDFRSSQMGVPFPRWLGSRIPVKGKNTQEALGGKKALFVGPTGVGKTTTIAKLAAIFSLWEKKNVLLLTADTYRIAAVEQLKMYARILGVPFRVIQNPEEASDILEEYQGTDIVLIDTAGRSQKDGGKMEELETLYRSLEPDVVHLVLAANMKSRDMEDVLQRMTVPLSSLVFTKLDETLSFGTLLGILLDTELPMSFLTAGQNVPNDIDVADPFAFAQLFAGGDAHVSSS
ncbi:MAG TPA: flagellar biosynthesis protein FlhF [Synergistaceae bacterium]|nr:flagellar biosynthesis protein FlhF [Synergistaceae bacterium]